MKTHSGCSPASISQRTQGSRGTVAIIGCGIAGPVLALALRQVGYSSTVYEAHSQPREDSGAFLTLAPNGLNALAAVGLRKDVEALGHPCEGLDFRNESGRLLGRIDGSDERLFYGVGTTLLRRSTLAKALREAAEASGIPIEFGKRLTGVSQADSGAVVQFQDGTEVGASMVLACDGVFSRTRHAILPCASPPRYSGLLSAGGVARWPGLAGEPRTMSMHFGREAFFGCYPAQDGDVYWFSNVAVRDEAEALRICSSGRREQLRDWIVRMHESDVFPIPQVIAATAGDIGCWPIYELPPLTSWSRESVCLLGDAAHATSPHAGQGASLAIEDAIALARAVASYPDAPYAFAAFEAERRGRVERLVAQSRKNGQTKKLNRLGRWFRDLLLPLFIRRYSMDWVYSYKVSLEGYIDEDSLAGSPLQAPARGDS